MRSNQLGTTTAFSAKTSCELSISSTQRLPHDHMTKWQLVFAQRSRAQRRWEQACVWDTDRRDDATSGHTGTKMR